MAKNYDDELESYDQEELFTEVTEMEVTEKKSILAKAKEKISAIGDMTLRDVGKGALKVGAAVGGVAAIVFGVTKLLGKDDEIDESELLVDITDDEGNTSEVVIEENQEENQ